MKTKSKILLDFYSLEFDALSERYVFLIQCRVKKINNDEICLISTFARFSEYRYLSKNAKRS